MDTGAISLDFASNELAYSKMPQGCQANTRAKLPAGTEIGIVTDDVPVAFSQAIEAGAIHFVNPIVKPWGQTIAYVREVDGMLVETL